jgi:hypothetical protein
MRRTALVLKEGPRRTLVHQGYNAYYGCDLASNRAYPLGSYGATPADDDVYNLTLNGGVLAYAIQPACPLAGENRCGGTAFALVQAIDLQTGKLIRSARLNNCGAGEAPGRPDCFNSVTGLVVSPTGGLAWIEGSEGFGPYSVHRSDQPAAPGQDVPSDNDWLGHNEAGEVDPNSLHYDGSEITYVRGGQVQRAPLQ